MSRHPVILLMLVLFLGSKISTQKGSRSDPTIYAEPGPVIAQGSFVTVVCSKSGDYNRVRLEKYGGTFMTKNTDPFMRDDRFLIGPVDETSSGHYSCIYAKGNSWSNRSEKLELKVIKEPVTQVPVTQVPVTQAPVTQAPVTQVPASGSRSNPTIYAEPGPVIAQGSSVTVVCSKSGDYSRVRLEKDGNKFMENKTSPNVREDRFLIGSVDETMTGLYTCIYAKGNRWSNRSEKLELKVIKESVTQVPVTQVPVTQVPVTQVPATRAPVTQVPVTQVPAPGPTVTSDTSWLKTYSIYICTVVSVIFLLCLSLFLFCFLSHRQKKQGLPDNKRQQQRPEERLKLATNDLEMTPVADNSLPEDRQTETRTPVARDLQEVTYAQLDHHSLTQRAVGAGTTQSTDVMAESITYADITRR